MIPYNKKKSLKTLRKFDDLLTTCAMFTHSGNRNSRKSRQNGKITAENCDNREI